MHKEQSRNAALDGLRALAITAVLLFHGGVAWAQGGFLGVDLFFVLSGFLITGLLLAEHSVSGTVNLLGFWSRRARRLVPALVVMLLAVVATVGTTAADGISARLRGDVFAALCYVANWRFAAQSNDYFAQQADPSPLEHTWSLAIEEQFYLLWPLVVVGALTMARGRRWLLTGITLLVAGACAVSALLAVRGGTQPAALYYRTDTRAPALLLGALLAIALARRSGTQQLNRPARAGLGMLALLGLAGSALLWHQASGSAAWLYQGGLLGAALASVTLVAAAALHPSGLFGRVLGVLPLRWLGRISYGVYLWHWPVYLALTAERTGLQGPALLGMRIVSTLAIATGSWFVVEQPLRRLSRLSLVLVPTALAASLAATVFVIYVAVPTAAPLRLTAATVAPALAVSPSPTARPAARPAPRLATRRQAVAVVKATPTSVRRRLVPKVTAAPVPARPLVHIDVLGDSVADSLGSGLQPVDSAHGALVTNRGIVGCGIADTPQYRLRGQTYGVAEECLNWEQTWAADVARDRPKVVLVVVGRHEIWDAQLDGRWTSIGQADFDRYLADQLDRAISLAAARGARVAMATTPYFRGSTRPDGGQYPENDPARVDRFNVLLRAAVARHAGQAFVVDLGRAACPDGHYTSTVHGVKIRKDGVHFSSAGARYLAPWLFPQLVG